MTDSPNTKNAFREWLKKGVAATDDITESLFIETILKEFDKWFAEYSLAFKQALRKKIEERKSHWYYILKADWMTETQKNETFAKYEEAKYFLNLLDKIPEESIEVK